MTRYPKCYIADGCDGDEACVVFCPADRTEHEPAEIQDGDQP